MSANHIVVGAGAVGTATARLLADSGKYVTIISRSGSGPEHPRIDRVGLDAGDVAALVALATGTTGTAAIYNSVNPQYHRWTRDWPPIAAALLAAAEASGAVLVMTGNLYPYGPVDEPSLLHCPMPLPARRGASERRCVADAKAAHDAGRVRAVECAARITSATGPSLISTGWCRASWRARVCAWWLRRRTAFLDYVPDVARTLVTVAADERAWGRRWLVPTNPPRTQRDAVHDLCRLRVSHPSRSGVPHAAMRALGVCHRRYASSRRRATSSSSPSSSTRRIPRRLRARPAGWDEACAETCGGFASRAPRRCRGRSD